MERPVTVTVFVPETIRGAVEGRARISLGVPASANLGDVLDTLLRLYPKLRSYVASERKGAGQGLTLSPGDSGQAGRPGLRDGQKLYLFSSAAARPGGRRS